MFRRRQIHVTVSQEADIRPIVCFLYQRMRDVGVWPLPAAEIAVYLVIEDLTHRHMLSALDLEILDRFAALNTLTEVADSYLTMFRRWTRVTYGLNVLLGLMTALWLISMIR